MTSLLTSDQELASCDAAHEAMQSLQSKLIMGRPVKFNVVSTVTPKLHNPKYNFGSVARGRRAQVYESKSWRTRKTDPPAAYDGPASQAYAYDRGNSTRSPASELRGPSRRVGEILYVGGLPRIESRDIAQMEITSLSPGFTVLAISKMMSPHESQLRKPGGYYHCFVDVAEAHESSVAINALDGQSTRWGGKLRVNRHKEAGILTPKVSREQFGGDENEHRGWTRRGD